MTELNETAIISNAIFQDSGNLVYIFQESFMVAIPDAKFNVFLLIT